MGLLLGKGGYQNNIARLQPPLNITMQDASFAADVLE
jgi:4-aminobutyrate aminotransferase-like enzyme